MPATPLNLQDLANELGYDLSLLVLGTKAGMSPGNTVVQGGALHSGSGVPSNGIGANGDFYFRTDTPGTLAQRIYTKSAGAWVNALA